MHILHLYKDYFPVLGGIENHIKLLAEAQAARGHRVTVLVTDPTPRTRREVRNGVEIIKAGRLATVASAPLSVAFPLVLRRLRPDVAHLHFPYPVAEVAYWLFGRARATVLTYHSDVVRQQGWLKLYAPLMQRALAKADRILATSPRYAETSPVLQRFRERVRIVPLGIETARFTQADGAAVAAVRRRYAPDGAPLLLFVGKLRYYKGVDWLLRALPAIAEARLLIVGEGPMLNTWRTVAHEAGVHERVHFVGEVPDEQLPAFYHAADVFVLPASARSEAFGTVLLEAMAAGLPLITTEVGTGTSWVNQHGVTGLVVPPRDPSALAEAVNTLVRQPHMRRAMASAARQRALQEFDVAQMVARVEAMYAEALALRG
ncbi:hypothetical protein ARMA_0762 [Ardenticatena maritima]|uniref:Glycosyltransferase n=1 Tax=Ardenticatena maritima TaxID=872965 RepID=A0A0M8K809_9CHLR|nr:glycosyltransferase [Ardenticatena maritima]KPL87299.1 hypothetical protein SE16_12490 [Ardenticatena maritima]GAP62339.1 hypothetical protein ARMA_0762 [Ardenticatena maritima]